MKRIASIIALILCLAACSKEEEKQPLRHEDIRGKWYGNLDEHWVSKPTKNFALEFDKGKVAIRMMYNSYTSGWSDSEGTYTIDTEDDIIINMKMADSSAGGSWVPVITITHAEAAQSALNGFILKLHYTQELRGELTNHWIWLKRERP